MCDALPRLLSPRQVATLIYGLDDERAIRNMVQRLYYMAVKGHIPCVRFGTRLQYPSSYFEGQRIVPPAVPNFFTKEAPHG